MFEQTPSSFLFHLLSISEAHWRQCRKACSKMQLCQLTTTYICDAPQELRRLTCLTALCFNDCATSCSLQCVSALLQLRNFKIYDLKVAADTGQPCTLPQIPHFTALTRRLSRHAR
jgi:hypothetical protein